MADLLDDKSLEKLFLTELESLEHFRISYTALFRDAPLGREDPDVRRLIEAMAFFSARTRQVSERSVNESLLQLFRQFFPYATSPLPAMALLRADTSNRFVDPIKLPRGMEVLARPGAARPGRAPYRFRTMAPLRVLPLQLTTVRSVMTRGRLSRLVLHFASHHPREEALDELPLLINHLDDLHASLSVFFALKRHLRSASVFWSSDVPSDTQGQPCRLEFGPPTSAPHEFEAFESPVERFRMFLHFPQAELFVRLQGLASPRRWQHLSLCLDFDDNWPIELSLTRDSFRLNVVPMANLRRDMADPITHDATVERHLLSHPDDAARFVPHSVLGAYLLADRGMEPLEPGILGPTRLGYESAFSGKGTDRRGWLLLELPGSFEKPERVAVEASWTQPDIIGLHATDLSLAAADRHVEGITWTCEGSLAPPADSEVEDRRDELLALTGLKGQRLLSANDLTFLLRALGGLRRPEFARLLHGMISADHRSRPAAGATGGLCQVYTLTFKDLSASDLPSLDLLAGQLLTLLQSWSIEQVVELITLVPHLGHTARYTASP